MRYQKEAKAVLDQQVQSKKSIVMIRNYILKNRVTLITSIIIAIAFACMIATPFIGIWHSWSLAWKIGFTGVALIIAPILVMLLGTFIWTLVNRWKKP